MKIAIFDENLNDSSYLKRLIYTFANYKKIELVVEVFSDINIFLNSKQHYNLFFISFKTKNGIRTAYTLFQKNNQTPIIITASDRSLAAEAFEIKAYNFIQTPCCENSLYTVLESFFRSFYCHTLLINNGLENIYINANDILYIEADNKHCQIHTKDQTIYCNKTMARVYEALPKWQFLKINRAFIVNAYCVSRFNSTRIILTNGDTVYPSRHFYKAFKNDFLKTASPKIP